MMSSLRIAMIGHGFMGATHSQGWRVAPRFFDLPRKPEMKLLVGLPNSDVASAAAKWGWSEASTDWHEAIDRDDVDVIDIVTPGDFHAEIAVAALDAGKHVLCEKPLANSVAEAEQMVAAAARAASRGVYAMIGFVYRRVPAVAFARELVASGSIGDLRTVRAEYLQDWLVDESAPLMWKLQKEHAGSGALGDIGAHAIDLAQFITGQRLTGVAGTIETVVAERPLLREPTGPADAAGVTRGPVTVDDVAMFTGRFERGALGSFVASRMSTGRKNSLRIEVSGSRGGIVFDLEDMNTLSLYDCSRPPDRQGFTKVLVTASAHPYVAAWWPPGHVLGWEHGFSHEIKDFVEAISNGHQPTPSFAEGLQVQRVLDAVEQSSQTQSVWTSVD